MDTIFAVSSGRPPAAIVVLRVSGAKAGAAGRALGGSLPPPRQAQVRALRNAAGDMLDRALVLWFPGPATATGEDLLELHLHGGRAIIEAVENAIGDLPGLRRAQPGEFTRRAMLNGRIDLAQAEGLADLLGAETERQRRSAIAATDGVLGARIRTWMADVAALSAKVEAAIDFSDDDDVPAVDFVDIRRMIEAIRSDMTSFLDRPTIDRLSEGIRVALVGPPNVGKSSLFNAMVERDAAIVTPIAGTTRDTIEGTVRRNGELFTLIDTAGLRKDSNDPIEILGMARSERARDTADLVLWMDDAPPAFSPNMIWVWARADSGREFETPPAALPVSSTNPLDIARLWDSIAARSANMLDAAEDLLLTYRQHGVLAEACQRLQEARVANDVLIVAEELRRGRVHLAELLGLNATEEMLDALFGRFCIGK